MSLHLLEIAFGIEESIRTGSIYAMTTSMERPAPLEEGFIGDGFWVAQEETVLAE